MDHLTSLLIALVSGALTLSGPSTPRLPHDPPAHHEPSASAPEAGTVDVLTDALRTADQSAAATSTAVELTREPDGRSVLRTRAGELTLALPSAHTPAYAGPATRIFDARPRATDVAVQSLDQGLRALVLVESEAAPERFAFDLGGDVARVLPTGSGGLVALDRSGAVIAQSPAPWARDASGARVPTRYEIDGTTVVQVVAHHGGAWSYPVVADPSFWSVIKCVGAITWVLGSTVLVVSKLLKVRAAIRSLGGVWDTAQLLLRATSRSEKLEVLGSAGASAAVWFFGIDRVAAYC